MSNISIDLNGKMYKIVESECGCNGCCFKKEMYFQSCIKEIQKRFNFVHNKRDPVINCRNLAVMKFGYKSKSLRFHYEDATYRDNKTISNWKCLHEK